MSAAPKLPPAPMGFLSPGEVFMLQEWAQAYGAACAAAEREACALLCEAKIEPNRCDRGWRDCALQEFAAAIRARGDA